MGSLPAPLPLSISLSPSLPPMVQEPSSHYPLPHPSCRQLRYDRILTAPLPRRPSSLSLSLPFRPTKSTIFLPPPLRRHILLLVITQPCPILGDIQYFSQEFAVCPSLEYGSRARKRVIAMSLPLKLSPLRTGIPPPRGKLERALLPRGNFGINARE